MRQQAEGRRPNLFLVGAPKSGTTSLHDHLGQHPEVFMSPLKETMHFSEEFRAERFAGEHAEQNRRHAAEMRAYFAAEVLPQKFGGIVERREDYLRLFAGAKRERMVGEASPGYLWSPTAAARIAEFEPRAKIVMILRNPVEREFSQYVQMWNAGGTSLRFEEYLRACLTHRSDGRLGLLWPGLESGKYAAQLQRYWDVFPREQVGVWLYEDSRQVGFHADVYAFLGVDPGFRPDASRRHLEQRVPRVRAMEPVVQRVGKMVPRGLRRALRGVVYKRREEVRMSVLERAMLVEYFARDVERLGGMLGRDLSGWLR